METCLPHDDARRHHRRRLLVGPCFDLGKYLDMFSLCDLVRSGYRLAIAAEHRDRSGPPQKQNQEQHAQVQQQPQLPLQHRMLYSCCPQLREM